MLSVRLPEDVEKRLDALAERTGRTKSWYVRQALIEKIEDLEDIYLAERVLERIAAGEEKTTPLAEVERELGLEH
jgi:RHH-type transcriptional regulator, rel operon repressor / antitoxin RelB